MQVAQPSVCLFLAQTSMHFCQPDFFFLDHWDWFLRQHALFNKGWLCLRCVGPKMPDENTTLPFCIWLHDYWERLCYLFYLYYYFITVGRHICRTPDNLAPDADLTSVVEDDLNENLTKHWREWQICQNKNVWKCRLLDYWLIWLCHFWRSPSIKNKAKWILLYDRKTVSQANSWHSLQLRPTGMVLCGRNLVTFLSSISLIWNSVHCHTVQLDKLSVRLEIWQRWIQITPHRGKRSFLTDGGGLPSSYWMRSRVFSRGAKACACVWWPVGAVLYTDLTCMQGMSAHPCWPDSVLAVTHLLLHLP